MFVSISHQSNKDLQDALSSLSDDKTIEITDKEGVPMLRKLKDDREYSRTAAEEIKNDIVDSNTANPANPANPAEQMGDNPFAQMEQMMQSSEIVIANKYPNQLTSKKC